MDLQQQHTDLQDILLTKDGQERQRRDMKIKSTFNISFKIHFVCFVLEEKNFSLFLEFY